jgi:MFS family permease
LLVFSCAAWGVITTLLALASSVGVMLALRCVHGAALSSLGPIAQSIIADITEAQRRGAAYGWMYAAIALGQITSSLFGTILANKMLAGGD